MSTRNSGYHSSPEVHTCSSDTKQINSASSQTPALAALSFASILINPLQYRGYCTDSP